MSAVLAHGYDILPPGTASLAIQESTIGNMAPGSYLYKVSFVTRFGETLTGPLSNLAPCTGGSLTLTNIPISDTAAGRRIYRSAVGGIGSFLLVGFLDDTITTQFTDILSDIDRGVPEPTAGFGSSIAVEEGYVRNSRPSIKTQSQITAAGSSIVDATQIPSESEYSFVTTPVALNGVRLPALNPELVGLVISVRNVSTNDLTVYPHDLGYTIGGSPSVVIPAETTIQFIAVSAIEWGEVGSGGGGGGGSAVDSFSAGSTGLLPNAATTGPITLSGTLNVGSGGTGVTTTLPGGILTGGGASLQFSAASPQVGSLLTGNTASAPLWTTAVRYNGTTITDVPLPATGPDVATKQYVDNVASGLQVSLEVRLSTTAALVATYDNGVGGVGATLTNNGVQANLQIDGTAAAPGDRILVKNQIAVENGIYEVTDIGSGATDWILTRAADYDNSPSGEVLPGNYVYTITGATLGGTAYVLTGEGTGTDRAFIIGTDPLVYGLFSTFTPLSAGTGITISSSVISNSGVLSVLPGSTGLTATNVAGTVTLGGTLAVASGGTGSTTGVTLDSTATPAFPEAPSTEGVWYGEGTQANSSATSVVIGNLSIGTSNGATVLGQAATATTDSVAIGRIASTAGTGNVSIGVNAGTTHTSGDNVVCIGSGAQPSSATATNEVTLGDSNITAVRSFGAYTFLSDARDKTDVGPMRAGLDFVRKLEPVEFRWQQRYGPRRDEDSGFLAQDLQAVQELTGIRIPGLVYEANPESLEISTQKLIPVLVKAIQEQQKQIDSLSSTRL